MKQKRVFISYDVADLKIAETIFKKISTHMQKPWMDRTDLKGGVEWEEKISNVIENETDYFLMILSNTSLKNDRFFKKEYELAIRKQSKSKDNFFIIPVTIEDINIIESKLPSEITKLHVIEYRENCEEIFFAIGLDTIRNTHPFLEGYWIGYSIEDVSLLGGKTQEIFPCLACLTIEHNIIVGEVSVDYKSIGETHRAILELKGYPLKNTIVFNWNNKDNILHEGKTILNVVSDDILAGYFTAVAVDTIGEQHGNAAFHKIKLDGYKR